MKHVARTDFSFHSSMRVEIRTFEHLNSASMTVASNCVND
jgi:hypothetical protein